MIKQEFQIKTHGSNGPGTKMVTGVTIQNFGIHRVNNYFIISHLPTGAKIWSTDTRKEALALAGKLQTLPIDWTISEEAYYNRHMRDLVMEVTRA